MVIGAIIFSFLALPLCALGVDTARWWVEAQRIQAAADAAATAGVTYMPEDFASATRRAPRVSRRSTATPTVAGTTVTVAAGEKPTQLKVTISRTVDNFFAKSFGVDTSTITRSAVADFNGPAPMGSPCNTFANEPAARAARADRQRPARRRPTPSASTNPQFWGVDRRTRDAQGPGLAVRDPQVRRRRGRVLQLQQRRDQRRSTTRGASSTWSAWQPAAVGQSISLQIYDPAYVDSGSGSLQRRPGRNLQLLGATTGSRTPPRTPSSGTRNAANASARATPTTAGKRFGSEVATITSFALREPSRHAEPLSRPRRTRRRSAPSSTPGYSNPTLNDLYDPAGSNYDSNIARVFHQWVDLCTFTPSRAGD